MLKSLKIENFRGFQSFELQQLGRINLLVGENNSGKTSILEAVQLLLLSPGNFKPLLEILLDRGELIWHESSQNLPWFDIAHLFYGHEALVDKKFLIESFTTTQESLTVFIQYDEKANYSDSSLNQLSRFSVNFNWHNNHQNREQSAPLFFVDQLLVTQLKQQSVVSEKLSKSHFVNALSFSVEALTELFDKFVLHPEESLVYEALRIIEPHIIRIAPDHYSKRYQVVSYRGGFRVLLSNKDKPIPIGSMGEGIWRMLGLSLALVNAKDGVLLVDDIDTGLHFSVMTKMWKLIWETAKRLNIQVFATTHSRDCWESLAELIESEKVAEDEISIHRIEKGKNKSIIFDADQIVIAAERGIEVR